MCYRPTTTVLATLNTTDFIYTCDTHLTDRGSATSLDSPEDTPAKKAVSQDEIDQAKKEWEERQERKKAKEKENASEDNKKTDAAAEKSEDKKSTSSDKSKESTPKPTPPTSPPPTRTHARYALHRDVFAMRLAEHKKRRQAKAVKEVAPRLPGAPQGALGPGPA